MLKFNVFIVLAMLMSCPIMGQTVLRVPEDYPNIQAAVDAASGTQDTILISPGTYTGQGNRDILIDARTVTIKGDGTPDEIVIDAEVSDKDAHNIFNVNGYSWGSLRIRNLTLQGSYGKSCIKSTDTVVFLESCILQRNSSINGGGISSDGGYIFCVDTQFLNNEAHRQGGGICSHRASVLIINSKF